MKGVNMNEIKLDNICFSDNTRILNHYNEIVIGNVRECGLWIKILTKDFEKIKTSPLSSLKVEILLYTVSF